MKNQKGDKALVDTMTAEAGAHSSINLFAEVDGVSFDSTEYETKEAWLQDICNRVYDCAMGKLN